MQTCEGRVRAKRASGATFFINQDEMRHRVERGELKKKITGHGVTSGEEP